MLSSRFFEGPLVFLMMLVPICLLQSAETSSDESQAAEVKESDSPKKELFTGKVVNVRKALKSRGIEAFKEMEDQVALETPDGELIPIVADWRGRAFYQDKRLRNRKVELVGYRREGVPYLQVLIVFTFDEEGQRQYTDYFCDVCQIPMYEIKPCDCCQGDIRLRFQPRDLPDYLKGDKNDSASADDSGESAKGENVEAGAK